jgi:hypothetical protein
MRPAVSAQRFVGKFQLGTSTKVYSYQTASVHMPRQTSPRPFEHCPATRGCAKILVHREPHAKLSAKAFGITRSMLES